VNIQGSFADGGESFGDGDAAAVVIDAVSLTLLIGWRWRCWQFLRNAVCSEQEASEHQANHAGNSGDHGQSPHSLMFVAAAG
jgi:hypothetical protein